MANEFSAALMTLRSIRTKLRDLQAELEFKRRQIRECEALLARQERKLSDLVEGQHEAV